MLLSSRLVSLCPLMCAMTREPVWGGGIFMRDTMIKYNQSKKKKKKLFAIASALMSGK